MDISIVVPCYNEEESIPFFYNEFINLTALMPEQSFEVIFVDDGSKDKTLEIFEKISLNDERVKYISLSRNFGKEAAIYAGLESSIGNYVVLMDADLQDPPYLLPEMYKAVVNDGYDSVATRRVNRKGEPIIRSFFARLFYKLMNKISQTELVDGARDYRLMNRKFVDSILNMKEYNRFSKGLFGWVGFKTKWIEFENVERIAGETKWSFWKLLIYAIEGVVAFSTMPLIISTIVGIVCFIVALLGIAFVIIRKIYFGDPIQGWASTVCILMFIGGVQLMCTGILGQYLAKTYMESKKRPIYIVDKSNLRR